MRLRVQTRGLIPALLLAVLGTVLLYLASTVGLAAWQTSRAEPQPGPGALPSVVENAPPSVPTTDDYGPVGGVSLVFAGTEVRDGLTGTLENPWIAVASRTGEYRAIVAPELPAPGEAVVTTSADGNLLAWPGGEGVVVHDAVTGESRELAVDGVEYVGGFSPDRTLLLAQGEQLVVLDVASGETVASVDGENAALGRMAWRADSSAVDLVVGAELTTLAVPDGDVTTQPTDIPEQASLAWSPNGQQLISLREAAGVKRLFLSEVGEDGQLSPGVQVDTAGIALDRLLGFSGERTVAVVAYLLESGSIERILDISLDGRSPADLTILPPPGENWVDTGTLAVAMDNLVAGSTTYEGQVWPWSYTSRLIACSLVMLFLLGLYVTRRPRSSRR